MFQIQMESLQKHETSSIFRFGTNNEADFHQKDFRQKENLLSIFFSNFMFFWCISLNSQLKKMESMIDCERMSDWKVRARK